MPEHALSHLERRLDIQVGQYSIAGIKRENDDAVGIRIPEGSALTTKGAVAVIADGVSAAEAGKEASQIAVTSFLSDYYSTHDSWSIQTSGLKVLVALNRWLYSLGQSYTAAEKGFITTFSALILKSAGAYIFHVGDSRIYRLRDGDFELLTRDHATPAGNGHRYLARALGIDVSLEIDFHHLNLQPGDRFLLTTDGVHDWLNNERLKHYLNTSSDHHQSCQDLIEEALSLGSDDNLSAQILCIESTGPAERDDVLAHLRTLPCPPPLEVGHILDDWRVLQEVHANTRSEVYLVENVDDGRKAVLKAPSSLHQDDPAYLERFLLEEWIGSRIHNAHVVKVLRPLSPRKFLYYLTEYVQGPTLAQLLKERTRLSVVDARNIITQVASGLRAFHRKDTLHQDIKPENVIYTDTGVKIIDFGSTHIAGISEITTTIERSNLLGTRDYSAPEYQLGQQASHRSDQFSLAILLYELLTGKHPYGHPYHKATTAKEFAQLRYTPSYEHNPLVPVWMDRAIQKAASLDPQQRYPALSEFIADLNNANPRFDPQKRQPLLERNPLRFWKFATILLLLSNLLLLALLSRGSN
ncbi:MAG: bifunctional protein-serine/threonine kinase/phosphatase [Gammaproteobacteria bacterium]|nr:MAG: bifunctional protein-serine/threonine kinase/phosphatase [Gammaproteobacteria bacterium]